MGRIKANSVSHRVFAAFDMAGKFITRNKQIIVFEEKADAVLETLKAHEAMQIDMVVKPCFIVVMNETDTQAPTKTQAKKRAKGGGDAK